MRTALATACGMACAVLILLAAGRATGDGPVGKWNTVDEKSGQVVSEVQLYDQGGKLYGRIVGLANPTDANGKPKVCSKCQGAEKDQPIIGLVIVKDLSPDKDRFKGGTILDPADGKVYKAELWSEGEQLKVRGYLGPFYKTQTWVKAK